MLSLFRPTFLTPGLRRSKAFVFPSPLYSAFKDTCYWLFSRKCTQEMTCGLPFKCALVRCTHTKYDVNSFTHSAWTFFTRRRNGCWCSLIQWQPLSLRNVRPFHRIYIYIYIYFASSMFSWKTTKQLIKKHGAFVLISMGTRRWRMHLAQRH